MPPAACAAINGGATGRAAIVLDTGAASRGSGNANSNKEKEVRRWFVEQDLIEGVIYLPENLFYNTSAPGIILFLNKAKAKQRRQSRIFSLRSVKAWASSSTSDSGARRRCMARREAVFSPTPGQRLRSTITLRKAAG